MKALEETPDAGTPEALKRLRVLGLLNERRAVNVLALQMRLAWPMGDIRKYLEELMDSGEIVAAPCDQLGLTLPGFKRFDAWRAAG